MISVNVNSFANGGITPIPRVEVSFACAAVILAVLAFMGLNYSCYRNR